MTFEKQSSSPAAIYPAFPVAPSAEPDPVGAGRTGRCWAALVLSRSCLLSGGGSGLRS